MCVVMRMMPVYYIANKTNLKRVCCSDSGNKYVANMNRDTENYKYNEKLTKHDTRQTREDKHSSGVQQSERLIG